MLPDISRNAHLPHPEGSRSDRLEGCVIGRNAGSTRRVAPEAGAEAEGELHHEVHQAAQYEDWHADPEEDQPDRHGRDAGFRELVAGDGLKFCARQLFGLRFWAPRGSVTNWEGKGLRFGK